MKLRSLYSFFPPILVSIALFIIYRDSLKTPFMGDEVVTYALPILRLMAGNWADALPWSFHPETFRGHAPLPSYFYATVLSVFGNKMEVLRGASLLITCVGLFVSYAIGKEIKGVKTGLFILFLHLGTAYFWNTAHLLLADDFFLVIFLLFALSWIKMRIKEVLFFGILMILTRESSLLVLGCFLLKSLLDRDPKKLRCTLPLFSLQLLWFFLLWLKTSHITPYYNDEGFYFTFDFISTTFEAVFTKVYLSTGWFLLALPLCFLFLKRSSELKKKTYELLPFLLVPFTFLLAFSFITFSLPRYHLVALSALSISLGSLIFSSGVRFLRLRETLSLLLSAGLMVFAFTSSRVTQPDHHTRELYRCAKLLRDRPIYGKVYFRPWPLEGIYLQYRSLTKLELSNEGVRKDIDSYSIFDLQDAYDFDYYAITLDPAGQSSRDSRHWERFMASGEREVILDEGACKLVRKKHD